MIIIQGMVFLHDPSSMIHDICHPVGLGSYPLIHPDHVHPLAIHALSHQELLELARSRGVTGAAARCFCGAHGSACVVQCGIMVGNGSY